jgi:putative transposase
MRTTAPRPRRCRSPSPRAAAAREEQIVATLKLAETSSVDEVCRKIGISRNTFYAWKKKFSGMDVSDARRLKQLEDENRRLKRLVADQALDMVMMKEVISKKW